MNFRDIAEQNETGSSSRGVIFMRIQSFLSKKKIQRMRLESASKKWDLRHIITRITMVSGQ